MMPHEDIHFQLVDLPAVSPEHPVAWLVSTFETADAALLVVDLHRDLARSIKYARVWGKSRFDGHHVGPNHPVSGGDVIELHA